MAKPVAAPPSLMMPVTAFAPAFAPVSVRVTPAVVVPPEIAPPIIRMLLAVAAALLN